MWEGGRARVIGGVAGGGHWLRGIVERKAESIGGAWLLTGGGRRKNNKTKPEKERKKKKLLSFERPPLLPWGPV